MVSSGAMGYWDGWLMQKPLIAVGLIKQELFTVVSKTVTLGRREGNFRPWKPWESMWPISGGFVNNYGLGNPGFEGCLPKFSAIAATRKVRLVVSILGSPTELVAMANRLNDIKIVAVEVNCSCPNTGEPIPETEEVVYAIKRVAETCKHPVIVKLSIAQNYLEIVAALKGVAEAVSLNSVPWEIEFPLERSPLRRLEQRVGSGGGVSGKPAQRANWAAVRNLAKDHALPIIAPSIMEFSDLEKVRALGADAVSFGVIHILTPWKATAIVTKDMALRKK